MKKLVSVLAALLLGGVAPLALAAHTHVLTPSTWQLNASASDFGGGPAMKSDRFTITTDTDKWLRWSGVTVDADGKTHRTSWNGPQDGTMKPIIGDPGSKAGFNSNDDTSHWVMSDGTVEDGNFSLSEDKKQVTITQTVKTKDGKEYNEKLIYDRVR